MALEKRRDRLARVQGVHAGALSDLRSAQHAVRGVGHHGLRGLLRRTEQTDWVILRLWLNGWEPFTDVHGFLAAEEVLRFAAHLFGQVMDRLGTPDDFLGHSGDNFILLTTAERVQALTAELSARFNQEVQAHYSFREREQGYLVFPDAGGSEQRAPLMTLAMRAITSSDGPFYDIRELTQALI